MYSSTIIDPSRARLEQKTIPLDVHKIPIEKIDPHALLIMEKLKIAGFLSYLVGGSVRDLLLGYQPKDFDISTSAKPEDVKKIFKNCILIGKRFRLAHIRFGKKIFEVSTFRSGDLETDALILRDNQWGYPEEDAKRRDFTINGLFYDPFSQTIIDYVDGYKDIKSRCLRTIGPPFLRFKQDPVRMLRLLKFQARFGFQVSTDAHIALVECKQEIIKSASARVLEELLRMLESGASFPFIRLLTEHGLMGHILPQVAAFIEKEGEKNKIYPFLHSIDIALKESSDIFFDRSLLLSSIAFPLFEKKIQSHFIDRNKIPHLGQIQGSAQELIDELFQGFFHIPRRLKMGMQSILVSQYRLTPLQPRRGNRVRIPKGEDFLLGLQFLKQRASIETHLEDTYAFWQKAYLSQVEQMAEIPPNGAESTSSPPKRKRRRRRKRASESEGS